MTSLIAFITCFFSLWSYSACTAPTLFGSAVNISSVATSTLTYGFQTPALNITSTSATSTFANGIIFSGGCLYINGSCLTGSSSSAVTVLYNNGNINASTAASATTTVKVVAIPANTLTTAKTLRITNYWTATGNVCWAQVDYGTGSATSTLGFGRVTNEIPSISHSQTTISATSTTGEYGNFEFFAAGGSSQSLTQLTTAQVYLGSFMVGVDTTAVSYLDFRMKTPAGTNCTLLGATVEVISS